MLRLLAPERTGCSLMFPCECVFSSLLELRSALLVMVFEHRRAMIFFASRRYFSATYRRQILRRCQSLNILLFDRLEFSTSRVLKRKNKEKLLPLCSVNAPCPCRQSSLLSTGQYLQVWESGYLTQITTRMSGSNNLERNLANKRIHFNFVLYCCRP